MAKHTIKILVHGNEIFSLTEWAYLEFNVANYGIEFDSDSLRFELAKGSTLKIIHKYDSRNFKYEMAFECLEPNKFVYTKKEKDDKITESFQIDSETAIHKIFEELSIDAPPDMVTKDY